MHRELMHEKLFCELKTVIENNTARKSTTRTAYCYAETDIQRFNSKQTEIFVRDDELD